MIVGSIRDEFKSQEDGSESEDSISNINGAAVTCPPRIPGWLWGKVPEEVPGCRHPP